MNKLKVQLSNCYGIKSLSYDFEFQKTYKRRSYVIYAPNGLMKSSFAKTFARLSNGELPEEPRFHKIPYCSVTIDGNPMAQETIFVLKAEIEAKGESSAVTNLLVKPTEKAHYDTLVVELEKQKQKAITALQGLSKVKKTEIESQVSQDFGTPNFIEAIRIGLEFMPQEDLSIFIYNILFNSKSLGVIQAQGFQNKATEFNQRYEELFQLEKTIYKKGVFNPVRAGNAFGSLSKEGFFKAGHRVHLDGDEQPLNQIQLDSRLEALHARLDGDQVLKNIRTEFAKTVETRELIEFLESLNLEQFEYLARMTKPDQLAEFRREIWRFCFSTKTEVKAYLEEYNRISSDIAEIENRATNLVPEWHHAVNRFNQRFLNMPFTLRIANEKEVALGKGPAKLLFVFRSEEGRDVEGNSELTMRTLSQGERRALHLLNFIFEVESRKKSQKPTLFIADDPADSFDYKNKHAIVQYLEDLTKIDYFRQIILTHNFDLFRTLTRFVHRDHCLAAVRFGDKSIALKKMEGVDNIFIKVWKEKLLDSDDILIATIPFTRNLIEYTKGSRDESYLKLTSLVHWKDDSETIKISDYLVVYNSFFGTRHAHSQNNKTILNLIMEKAQSICVNTGHSELELEKKIVLSIATRITAERWMTHLLRILKSEPEYWCPKNPPFGELLNELKSLDPTNAKLELLACIGVTVSSNIHLNSFMYEPLLDLSFDHLINLFMTVRESTVGNGSLGGAWGRKVVDEQTI
jgi:hypothetical protein